MTSALLANLTLIGIGLGALFFGGEALIRGAVSLAKSLGLPALIISLTVVGFGTSMPELLVSIRAAFANAPDIALGNVVGSNTANILLILGVCLVAAPITRYNPGVRRDIVIATAVAVILLVLVQSGSLSRMNGVVLFAALIAYLVFAYVIGKREHSDEDIEDEALSAPPMSALATAGWLIGGFALLFAGAESLVRGAVAIARDFGISEAVIGLTIVAVGTSLPELATSLVAAIRRQGDIALGNIVGSNIFNILGILGIASMIKPIPASANFLAFDVPIMVATSVALLIVLWSKMSLSRLIGVVFLIAYASYTIALANGVTRFF